MTAVSEHPGRHVRTVIGLISAGHFFSHFFLLGLAPLFPLIKASTGASYTQLGGIAAVYALCSGLSQYPTGMAVDRFGARVFLIGGLTIISLCFIGMGLSGQIATLFVLAAIGGLADGVFHPCNYAILGQVVRPEVAGRAYSVHAFGGFAGFGASPLVMVPLGSAFGWQTALVVAGALGLTAAGVLFANRDRLLSGNAPAQPDNKKPAAISPMRILTSRPLLLMFGFYVLSSTASMGLNNHAIAIFMARTGLEFTLVSIVLPAFLWGMGVGIFAGGFAADFIKRLDLTATLGLLTASALVFTLALTQVPLPATIALMFFAGFGYGTATPSRDIAVRSVAPPGALAQSFGFVNTGYSIGGAAGPVIVGWLLDQHYIQAALMIPAIALLLAMTCTFSALKSGAAEAKREPVVSKP